MKSENRNKLTITLFVVYMLLLTGVILFKLPFYFWSISAPWTTVITTDNNTVGFQGPTFRARGILSMQPQVPFFP